MKKFIIPALLVAPTLAFAQGTTSGNLGGLENLLRAIGRLIDIALPIVVALALLGFFWGLAKFVFAAGDEDKRKEAVRHMIWGVVAVFVMVSVWGLVRFIGGALGVGAGSSQNQSSVDIPRVQNVNGR